MRSHRFLCVLILFLLLIGCESEKEIDEQVKQYVSVELGIQDINIIYSEKKNEGNMGDRSYVIETKKYPIIEFSVYLEGLVNTKIALPNWMRLN
ncbi:hypothetical protein FZW96_08705 [Bacillus sp. BGMRC 2118]|nr:hypothetical protein FZW96_08705 [Bacillus sp. BGMRC 2118]